MISSPYKRSEIYIACFCSYYIITFKVFMLKYFILYIGNVWCQHICWKIICKQLSTTLPSIENLNYFHRIKSFKDMFHFYSEEKKFVLSDLLVSKQMQNLFTILENSPRTLALLQDTLIDAFINPSRVSNHFMILFNLFLLSSSNLQ